MNKTLFTTITATTFAMPAIGFAQAQLPSPKSPAGTGAEPIISILNTLGNWMFGILLAVAVVYILLAAFKFLMAEGDTKKTEEARKSLQYALIAVVVAAVAKGLVEIAKAVAGGTGLI